MTAREQEEYTALRATIRERGTARVCVFAAGLAGWAALALGTAALFSLPVANLLPLLVLASVFEAVFALHVGVERVGRYLQVFYEDQAERAWEHTAMAFGRGFKGVVTDPLFAGVFWLATVLNFMPTLLFRPTEIEWVAVAAVHVVFAGRVFLAKRGAGRQRAVDLERFEDLKRRRA